jgi:hypothetical protein
MKTKSNVAASSDYLDRLVRLCVTNHPPEELALGWLRYEALRRVNPRIFAEINRRNMAGVFFDDVVTEALLSWRSPDPNAIGETRAIANADEKTSPNETTPRICRRCHGMGWVPSMTNADTDPCPRCSLPNS